MQIYQREKCLKEARQIVFGLGFSSKSNKAQELIRLIYEISLRDNIPARDLLPEKLSGRPPAKELFNNLKNYLIQKRYPFSSGKFRLEDIYLPRAEFDPRYVAGGGGGIFFPKNIFIEEQAYRYPLSKSIRGLFKGASVTKIKSLKHHLKLGKRFSIRGYNQRRGSLFLVKEKYDFVKPCPCTKGCVCCGYVILNLGFGCIYECSYCFLQGYTNVPGIVIPVNIDDYLNAVEKFIRAKKGVVRIGTGEFTDSLALDHITGFSKILVPFFAKFENVFFELKTKSSNIKNLLGLNHNGRAVIAWSLNPEGFINSDEAGSSGLEGRLEAAEACVNSGYLAAFHFDPIIYSQNWQARYKQLLGLLFKKIKKENIAWISLGAFRFPPVLKPVIEQRFPETKILNEELILGFDRKIRYSRDLRISIYKNMANWIRGFDKDARIYLCMESPAVWEAVFGEKPNARRLFSLR